MILLVILQLGGCSMGQIVVRTSASILDGGVEAMNREADLEIARLAVPAQLKLLEGMIVEDPANATLRVYAAQALSGYAIGFVEPEDPVRAAALFRRGFEHGVAALHDFGLTDDIASMPVPDLQQRLARLKVAAVPALFWTASNWAKWIDLNRDDPAGIAELASAAALMERVLELQEDYYYGSPHTFFGVYYGGRAPMFGGDMERSAKHFDRANQIAGNRLLMTDVWYAEFLARQRLDRETFHQRLMRVMDAPDDLLPEMALANAIAKQRAQALLQLEEEWF